MEGWSYVQIELQHALHALGILLLGSMSWSGEFEDRSGVCAMGKI